MCASVEVQTRRAFILGLAPPPTRRDELAEFLRNRREATSPDAVGLAPNGNRRTPGLRREEVSQLAGVGLSWEENHRQIRNFRSVNELEQHLATMGFARSGGLPNKPDRSYSRS